MFLQSMAELIAKIFSILGLSVSLTVMPLASALPAHDAPPAADSHLEATSSSINENASTSQPEGVSQNLPAGAAWLDTLPLGDGKYVTSEPKKGYIYLCHVGSDRGSAGAAGNWINESSHTWNPTKKLHVSGNISWPGANISIKLSESNRLISTNDLPVTHTSGIFPISSSDRAFEFDRNPNSISAQKFSFTLPANPTINAKPDCIYGEVGVMTGGVLLFDGFDAGNRDAAAWEVQDDCGAHPQIGGAYHYHNLSSCIKNIAIDNVIGYAFDGFPITGPKLPNGNYVHTADLDECHGLVSEVSVEGRKTSTYHYVMTQDFPYSVSCFKGKSTQKGPVGGGSAANAGVTSQNSSQSVPQTPPSKSGGQMSPPAGGPPHEAIDACSGMDNGVQCSFISSRGDTISGVCDTPPNSSLACIPR